MVVELCLAKDTERTRRMQFRPVPDSERVVLLGPVHFDIHHHRAEAQGSSIIQGAGCWPLRSSM
eukprot:4369663-Pyramimonas_sp.AAC.1